MSRQCDRPACGDVAQATLGYDYASSTAWLDDVALERPRNRDHGDWASNVAMKLGKRLGLDPRAFATDLAAALGAVDGIASAMLDLADY